MFKERLLYLNEHESLKKTLLCKKNTDVREYFRESTTSQSEG